MQLEYFQLIDRIVELDLAQPDHPRRGAVSRPNRTIFEGHFPGYPLMPGVLLIEAMAQTSGWLVIAVTKFTRMPFLAALKEAKLRSFVTPGRRCRSRRKLLHEGSGFAVTKAEIRCDGKLVCNAEITFRLVEFPNPEFRAQHGEDGAQSSIADGERRPMADAPREAWITGIGIVSCLGEGPEAHWQALNGAPPQRRRARPSRPTSSIRSRRSISTSRSRRRATSARWSPGSASAPMPPASRSTAPASKAMPNCSRAWT